MHIRAARLDDFDAITAIYGDAVRNDVATFETTPPDRSEMISHWQALRDGGFSYLVADEDGHIAGYAYIGPYHRRPAYRTTVENTVYVDDAFHRRGIGRSLLAGLIDEAERLGFRQMIAVISDTGSAASTGLHGALGFAYAGLLKDVGFKHGRWIDVTLMQRSLGAGNAAPPGNTR